MCLAATKSRFWSRPTLLGTSCQLLEKSIISSKFPTQTSMLCASKLANWQGEVPELQMSIRSLSEVDRGFKFCESSFLGVLKLWEGWYLVLAVSLALFHSVMTFCDLTNMLIITFFSNNSVAAWPDPSSLQKVWLVRLPHAGFPPESLDYFCS